ncbi:sirohydrochlorin chelatase [Roseateles sp. UC29_93]|uniref:sirohydrochlorin chelatase n=1 Tax=Roseateles sp. UC29_93 TaxID=3350177 RepID=UPI00366F282D
MDSLLLFAHGARDPAWAGPFQAIAAELQMRCPDLPIALAYLELMTPDLATAAGALVAVGATRVQIVPMFLGASGHVRRDVPPLVESLRGAAPGRAVRAARRHRRTALGDPRDGGRDAGPDLVRHAPRRSAQPRHADRAGPVLTLRRAPH